MAGADQMRQYTERYDALKAELQSLGFLFQGSLQTRRIVCGKTTCRCYHDPDARHGPYHYWTRKARGKTVGMRLTEDELVLYQEWIENNRELERIVRELALAGSSFLASPVWSPAPSGAVFLRWGTGACSRNAVGRKTPVNIG